jgi:hypothetical protein
MLTQILTLIIIKKKHIMASNTLVRLWFFFNVFVSIIDLSF